MACLTTHAAQTLDQGADSGEAGGRARARQLVQKVVGELHEEVSAAGGRQVAKRPDRPLAHRQARATQLRQQAVQEAGVEGAQGCTQPGESDGASGRAHQKGQPGPDTSPLPSPHPLLASSLELWQPNGL